MHVHVLFRLNEAKRNKQGVCPVEVRLTYLKQRKQLATGYFLTPGEWMKLQQGIKTRSASIQQVREFMETFKTTVYRTANTLAFDNRLDLVTLVDLCLGKPATTITLLQLFAQHREELQKRQGLDRTRATLDKYRYTEDKLRAFLRFRFESADLAVSKLELSFMQHFYDYMLLECRIHHNTIAKYCKNLKRVLNYGKEKGLVKENPFASFQVGYKNIDRSYLTTSELAVLENKQMSVERLAVIKDLFLFQCYTGLAFADLLQLRREHLVEGIDGEEWLVFHRQKTKVKSTVPLLPQALVILQKYAGSTFAKEGRLLPSISNQKLNAYLKEIGDLCGISKPLTSHMGRRTFATTVALSNGISMESIARMLGHTSIKITTLYAVVTDRKLSEEMASLRAKLGRGSGKEPV